MPEARRRYYDDFNGIIIVGAGPSGLAVAAVLSKSGIPYIVIEIYDCVGSLWKYRTYDNLKLQLPKQHCQLPNLPIPEHFPDKITNKDFSVYLDKYTEKFNIEPHCRFNECIKSAKCDKGTGHWLVVTEKRDGDSLLVTEYTCFKLVVATGENAEPIIPEFDGLQDFLGDVIHAKDYKSGEDYNGKKVLVVGSGNSGIDISLDLSNHEAVTFTVVRALALDSLQKFKPFDLAEKLKNFAPSQFKNYIDDEGALEINAIPAIKRFCSNSVELINGDTFEIDSVVWATGYRTNVLDWLQDSDAFNENGYPKDGWKGERGIYAAGFTGTGLEGISEDATKICSDIKKAWTTMTCRQKLFEGDDMSGYGSYI